MRWTLSLALASLVAGCATNPAPVPISADPEGQALLLGDWSGTYFTTDGGRVGSIVFQFHQHDSTGFECLGDVVMVPRTMGQPVLPADEGGVAQPEEAVRVLAIEHIRVTGHQISGVMTPYQDPETGEGLSTTFEGRIDGDTIKGTLLTIHARSGVRDDGTWDVTRRKN